MSQKEPERLDISFHEHIPDLHESVPEPELERIEVRRDIVATDVRYRAIVAEATTAKTRLTQAGFSMQQELNWLSAVTIGFLKDAVADIVGGARVFGGHNKPAVPPHTNFYILGSGSIGRYEIIGASDLDVMIIALGPDDERVAATQYGNWLKYTGTELFTYLRTGQLTIGALHFDNDPGLHCFRTKALLFNSWQTAADNIRVQRYAQFTDSILLHQEGPDPNHAELREEFFSTHMAARWPAFFQYQWGNLGAVPLAFATTDALNVKGRLLRPIQMLLLPFYFQQITRGRDLRTTNIQRLWGLVEKGPFDPGVARKAEDLYLKALRWELNANLKLNGGTMKLHHAQAASDRFKRKFTAEIRTAIATVAEVVAELKKQYNAANPDAMV